MTHLRCSSLALLLLALLPAAIAAQQDRLTFAGPAKGPGTSMHVTYAPNGAVTGNTVELRARLRHRNDWLATRTVTLALLHKEGDRFVGAFEWPDSVVTLVLAIGGNEMKRPDTNGGRFWELLATNAAGEPTSDAMWQRVLDRGDPQRQDWEGSLAAAREFTAAYPDVPEAWFALSVTEATVLGAARSEASARFTEAKLNELNAGFALRHEVSLNSAETLATYWGRRDSANAAYWTSYILAHFPATDFARRARLAAATGSTQTPQAAAAAFDSLWAGDNNTAIASAAYRSAARTKDPIQMRRWGARLTQVSPQATGVVAADFLTVPELADEGIRLLEQRWTMLQAEDTTVPPLNASESAIRDSRIQARANAAAALARAVIARGDTARAANLYATIVSVAWNTRILSDAAALSLQLGDTATAVRSHARAAATGNAPANLLASAEAAIPGLQTRVDWREARRAARTQYAALIRENEIAVPIDLNLQVTDSSGRPVTLRELSAQRPLVLAFWSPYCGPSIASLPEIDALAAAVEAKGARFVSIVALPRTPDVLTLVTAQKLVRPQFYPGADIGRALGQWKTPDTYIIDSGGILRYAHSAPSQTQAEFEVLVEFR